MGVTPFTMLWWIKWEDLILSVCVISSLVEKGFKSSSPVPKFFPFLFVSCLRLLPSPGDSQWNVKDSVMSLDEDDLPGHKVSIRYLGKGDCAAANTSVNAPELERWKTLQQQREPWVLVGSPGLCAQWWGWAAPKAQRAVVHKHALFMDPDHTDLVWGWTYQLRALVIWEGLSGLWCKHGLIARGLKARAAIPSHNSWY